MLLNVESIQENPLNKRSMDDEEIQILAESIQSVGLMNPLAVYPYPYDEKYIVLSGHKRLRAIKLLGIQEVECAIHDAPSSDINEKEQMLQANMHRSSKEDILNEVAIAEGIWERMPKELQNKYSKKYQEEFLKKNPEKSIKEFRPKLEYIIHMTGLSKSYRTVQDYILQSEVLKAETEEINQEETSKKKEKKKKKVRDPHTAAKAMIIELEYMVSPECEELDVDQELARKIERVIYDLKMIVE